MNFKKIIRQIAKQNGVTSSEVKEEMEKAMKISMASHNHLAITHWKNISQDCKEPQLEDFVTYIVKTSIADFKGF